MNPKEKISTTTATRIENAILFIEKNLEEKLILEEVAKQSHFSPFHFHRLFSVVVGETPHHFITRKRIERAASHLMNKRQLSITEISEKAGFSSLSLFSRAFKKFYHMSPTKFREISPGKFSKICKTKSKNGQIAVSFEQYICNINNTLNWLQMNATTEVKQMGPFSLAYISHQGNMNHLGQAYDRLMRWAAPRGLMAQENVRMLTIYHDSPKITDPNHLRMSASIILNEPVKAAGEVNLRTLNTTKCIVSRLEITSAEFQQAWESNFVWMVEHGYQKGAQDPFEIYYNNPNEHPEGKCLVDLCIPIQ